MGNHKTVSVRIQEYEFLCQYMKEHNLRSLSQAVEWIIRDLKNLKQSTMETE